MAETRLDNLIYALVATVGEAVVALKHAGALHGEDALLGRPGVRNNNARERGGAAHGLVSVATFGVAAEMRWWEGGEFFARLGGSLCVGGFFLCAREMRRALLLVAVECS